MRIAICDANAAERGELIAMLRTALSKEAVSYQICEYTRARDLLYDVQDGACVDAAFVDLAMAEAWESLLALREWRFDGFLILMSDCGERVVDGYSIEAQGYLMKPFRMCCVQELLSRLCSRLHTACLTIDSRSRIVRVPYHEILYIESRNAKCLIHRIDGEQYTLYAHLDDLERELCDERFLRCHQSYLVNMDHIVAADKQFEMANGDVVSIRQRELRRLRDRYRAYVFPSGRDV